MKTISALAAKQIKLELKKEFPLIKFSVTSQNFAGGNSVGISWENGPTDEAVNKITKKYQYGSFDGMTDSYDYTNSRDDIPQAKWVQTSRKLSAYVIDKYKTIIAEKFGIVDKENDQEWMKIFNAWPQQVIWRELEKRDLTLEF